MFAEFWRVLLFLESISILNVNFSIVLSILHATYLFIVFLLCLEIGLLNDMFTKELQCTRFHYSDVTMDTMASHITSLTIIYLTVIDAEIKKKHQSPASLAFVWGIHRWPVNSPHKWPVTRKMFPFDDVIMQMDNSQSGIYRNLNYTHDNKIIRMISDVSIFSFPIVVCSIL